MNVSSCHSFPQGHAVLHFPRDLWQGLFSTILSSTRLFSLPVIAGGVSQGLYKQRVDIFRSMGMEAVSGKGTVFDPNFHDAIMREQNEDVPEGTILQEFRRGFKLGDRLLRPAMVQVRKPSPPCTPERRQSKNCMLLLPGPVHDLNGKLVSASLISVPCKALMVNLGCPAQSINVHNDKRGWAGCKRAKVQ